AVMGYEVVLASDYDALAAEAQALREEVARGNRIALAMALDIAAVGVALGIPGEQQEGGTGEFIEAIQSLQKELEALRARVVVAPERKLLNAGVPGLNRNSGWNACLDELARLNGKTVSEGLLRRISDLFPADMGDDGSGRAGWFPHVRATVAELRALLSEQEGRRQ
ncbi:hypothetical protein ACM75T_30790, partial [Pseudomonas aeruginosa]